MSLGFLGCDTYSSGFRRLAGLLGFEVDKKLQGLLGLNLQEHLRVSVGEGFGTLKRLNSRPRPPPPPPPSPPLQLGEAGPKP